MRPTNRPATRNEEKEHYINQIRDLIGFCPETSREAARCNQLLCSIEAEATAAGLLHEIKQTAEYSEIVELITNNGGVK